MANKVALIVLGVVILVSMGVGALVGLQVGPGGSTGAADTPTATADGTTTSDGSNGSSTETGTTATATGTPTPPPTVAASEFDAARIEAKVLEGVNIYRNEIGIQTLRRDSTLREMARFHSENMAGQRYVSHSAAGFNTQERYEKYEMEDSCNVPNNQEKGLVSGENLETLRKTVAGRPFQENGETRYYRDETAVAEAVVNAWIDSEEARKRLKLENADRAGVGVVVTENGRVYVTMDLC